MHCPKLTRVCVLSLLFAVSVHVSKGELQIQECSQGWLDLDENSQSVVTCSGYDQQYSVQWLFRDSNNGDRGQFICPSGIIQCEASGSVDGSLAQRYDSATTLTITSNHRLLLQNRRLECYGYVQDAATSDFCNANVISPAVISNCSVSFESQTWIVSGTCYFADTYSTNDTYYCSWIQKLIPSVTQEIPGVINKTSYIKTNKLYYNGTCSFTTQLTKLEGLYTYGMRFYPATGITSIARTFLIDSPGPPIINCPDVIQEGADVSCTCLRNPVFGLNGSPPPAYFQWDGFPAGPTLTVSKVTRQQNGQVFTCRHFWGPSSDYDVTTVNFTLNVAYVPDTTESLTTTEPAVTTARQQTVDKSNNNEITGGGIGIGIVIGVAVSALVVAAFLLVRWFRGRQIYDRPTPRNRRTDEHTYTDMTVYEQVGGAKPNTQPPAPVATSAAKLEYENSKAQNASRASYVNTACNVDAANPYDN